MELRSTNSLVGVISLEKIDDINMNAQVGFWVKKDYWNRGIATESLRLIVNFGFRLLKLQRIYARVLAANLASITVLEKCGFEHEGTLRRHRFKNNRFHDLLIYGILRSH
jgi:ribosomal-protein-alanine N-acetyltransferase